MEGVFFFFVLVHGVSERWIMAGVPASSQIHAPKMTFPNFGTKFIFRIDSICWLQREQK